jgi:flagellar hook protein FlgE
MFTSFSTALSALAAQSTAIDVVGNNLANLNTPGFKSSVVSFHDLVTQSLGAGLGDTQVGFGVGTPITLRQFSQGAIQTTGGTLDAAIQGDGFLVIQGANQSIEYTRGGNLQVDKDGNLTTATGEAVQGWTEVNGVLNTNAPPGNITIPVGTVQPPVTSKNISFDMNLNAAAVPGGADATFATSVTVYDSLGNSHIVTATFIKDPTTAGQWNYSIVLPDGDLQTPPFTPLTGSVAFDSNGKLATPASTDPSPQLQITGLKDGASDMTIYPAAEPIRPAVLDIGGGARRIASGPAGAGGGSGRRPDFGAILQWPADRRRAARHGNHSKSGVVDRRWKQQLPAQRPFRSACCRAPRHRRARINQRRRGRGFDRRHRQRIHESDCLSARV